MTTPSNPLSFKELYILSYLLFYFFSHSLIYKIILAIFVRWFYYNTPLENLLVFQYTAIFLSACYVRGDTVNSRDSKEVESGQQVWVVSDPWELSLSPFNIRESREAWPLVSFCQIHELCVFDNMDKWLFFGNSWS